MNFSSIKLIYLELQKYINPSQVELKSKFFKTGVGEYGHGDKLIAVSVPDIRKIAKQFKDCELNELEILLKSKINEERLLALIILVNQFTKADYNQKTLLYKFYLKNIDHVNNWNLVDSSAHLIVGRYLHEFNEDTQILVEFAKSQDLWRRRIAIVATKYFINNSSFDLTLEISKILLRDQHDLIHKAVGWMLREVGIKNKESLFNFLNQHAPVMPRTMLRYAIEKFPQDERSYFLYDKNLYSKK